MGHMITLFFLSLLLLGGTHFMVSYVEVQKKEDPKN
jgi:hypothetical protein